MSKVTLQIIAQVTNQASKPLKDIQKGLTDTGAAANKVKFNFTELNRALFSTKAFFGLFSKVFSDFKTNLSEAANMDRVETSFKNVFGQNSDIITSLDNFSSIGVNRMDAMKESISLGMLGIAKNSDQAAKILAGAAYGAKQAGVDTSEGMAKIVQGLKDGSLSGLEYLNMVRSNDPVLKAQLELLTKYSGAIGGAVTAQAKYNLILNITNRLSELAKDNQEDLVDSLAKLENSFSKLKQTVGSFLGQALGGIVKSLKTAIDAGTKFIKTNTESNKGLIYLAKAVIIATTAFGGLYATLYSIKMISTILASSGIGFPFLKGGVLGLAAAFLLTTNNTEKLIDKFKVFGNFIQGVYELVTNLDPNTGISKIDSDIQAILQKNGIYVLAQNFARAISVIKAVVQSAAGTVNAFTTMISNSLKPIISIFQKIFGFNGGPWSKSLIDGTSKLTSVLGKLLLVVSSLFALKKIGGIFGNLPVVGSLLQKVPVIGSMFKSGEGRGSGPSGSAADPLHVVLTQGVGDLFKKALSKGAGKLAGSVGTGPLKNIINVLFKSPAATTVATTAAGTAGSGGLSVIASWAGILANTFRTLIAAITPATVAFGAFATAATAIAGFAGWSLGQDINSMIKGTKAEGAISSVVGSIADLFGVEGTPEWEKKQAAQRNSNEFISQYGSSPTTANPIPLSSKGLKSQNNFDRGLNSQNQVAYIPKIPETLPEQLALLKATKQSVEPKEKDIFVKAIQDLTNAMYENLDPETTAKMTEEAYVRARQRTREPVRQQTARRGC